MRIQPSPRRRSLRSQSPVAEEAAAADSALSLSQEQMLVNQALVEKILECKRTQEALRASEQKLHELLAHQSAAREAERKQMSRDLHDSLAQNLLALRIDIVMLQQLGAERDLRMQDRTSAALDNIDITLRTVKHMLGELRPAALELGLPAMLASEIRKFTRASGIACDVAIDPSVEELALDEAALLLAYRVLQECLNNVVRHSLASRVRVQLDAGTGMLVMVIADNGIGFEPSLPRPPGSYGLFSLEEMASAYGGALGVVSAHGQGTRIVLALRLDGCDGVASGDAPIG